MNVNQQAERLLKVDEEDRVGFLLQDPGRRNTLPDVARQKEVNCNASLRTFDWRSYGKVSPVRRQVCGNCWAFAAVAAYEASYLIRNNQIEDGSEQYINDCSRTNSGDAGRQLRGRTGIERARAHRARGRRPRKRPCLTKASTGRAASRRCRCTRSPGASSTRRWIFPRARRSRLRCARTAR